MHYCFFLKQVEGFQEDLSLTVSLCSKKKEMFNYVKSYNCISYQLLPYHNTKKNHDTVNHKLRVTNYILKT